MFSPDGQPQNIETDISFDQENEEDNQNSPEYRDELEVYNIIINGLDVTNFRIMIEYAINNNIE